MMETERLLLRPWRESDAEALFKWASDPDVGERAGWPPHKSVEESLEIIKTLFNNDTTWAIVLKDNSGEERVKSGENGESEESAGTIESVEGGEPIGAIGYGPSCDCNLPARDGEPLIGYWIAKPYWNQGICTEALQLMIDNIRDTTDIPSLISGHFIDNPASGCVMEKCGFAPTGETCIDPNQYQGDDRPIRVMRLEFERDSLTSTAPSIPSNVTQIPSSVLSNSSKSKRKKVLSYLTSKEKRAVLRRAFHIWQITPPKLAPLSESTHECASCGTEYQGNYCPRCGQSATVGRFSFKKALIHFLNVWGLGNRGMFRSVRDLMLRPGYMIRDYLSGMQSAYFPPFKMFFLFVALSLLVEHGCSFSPDETKGGQKKAKIEIEQQDNLNGTITVNGKTVKMDESPMYYIGMKFADMMKTLREKNPAIFSLLALLLFSWPLFFFLRKTPKIPDLRFSEFIVALVYTSNTNSIFLIIGKLLSLEIFRLIAVIMVFVALHQFSGYKKWRILGYLILTFVISWAVLALVFLAFIGISYLFVAK